MSFYKPIFLTMILALSAFLPTFSQVAQYPIVKGFGGIYEIPEATERPDPNGAFKIIIDLASPADDPKQINRMVDNIARMVNLHGIGGVSKENIKVKVAVHGGAIFSILNDEEYQERFGVKNPNLPVYDALREAGVEFYICGQSLVARDMKPADMWQGAELALSMLTTLTKYVPLGYTLLRF